MKDNPAKKVLLYYHFNGTRGGGDFLPLCLLEELCRTCNVTLAVDYKPGFEVAAELFGFCLKDRPFKVESVMPDSYNCRNLNLYYSLYRFLHLKKLAFEADVCISAANIANFGRPAHHFINCIDFGDKGFLDFVCHRKMSPLKSFCRNFTNNVLRPLCGLKTRKNSIGDQREHIYPNSEYVDHLMRCYYPPFNGRVFYPPTLFEPGNTVSERDPMKIVYLGRGHYSKKIADIVDIVQRARAISGLDLKLYLAGFVLSAESKHTLGVDTAGKNWIIYPGELYGKAKVDYLFSGTYAIHAMREEAFGISITEYLKSGLIPIVPDEGGACEVVNNRDLVFHTNEEAANILVRLLNDPEFHEKQRSLCEERAKFFSKAAYMDRQHKLLQSIIGDRTDHL